jgi:thiol-disulfide isomerase/thioredoxin
MTLRARIIIAVAVCGVLGLLVYFLVRTMGDEGVGTPAPSAVVAPDFRFPDASGKDIVLSEVEARVRVVNFWASWSPYSRKELPALVALQEAFGDEVAVIALNRDTDPAEGRAFLTSLGLGEELLFAYDQSDTYFKELGGYNMPETVFVGLGGEVLVHVHGPMEYQEMRETVERLLE